jgi:hypothetical protein
MVGIGKSQMKFLLHIFQAYLSIRTRCTYSGLGRLGLYGEQSYRRNFAKSFDFQEFNRELILRHGGSDRVWIFDPSYIQKSGRSTPGVGYFWSGSAGKTKRGIEISGLAVGDVENHTAYHYHAKQTLQQKGKESLLAYYARQITEASEELQKISKEVVVDAYFSKKSFIDIVHGKGFEVVSRFAKNAYLQYKYVGEQKPRGRRKQYDGKIDVKNVSRKHFRLMAESAKERSYEGVAYARGLERWVKVVIVQKLEDGVVKSVRILFSTNTNISGERLRKIYELRFQIEFLFRDAKQFVGLEDSQSRQKESLEFHFNVSLTTLNIAKVAYWLSQPKESRCSFSMADIKTKHSNELLLDRLILIYGKDPNVEKNRHEIRALYDLGKIAA